MGTPQRFRLTHAFKLGLFYAGASLTDLITSAVWNRLLVVELGVPATPVSLLTSLRYLLAPLSLLAGYLSDTRPLLGFYRTAYIWLGRALMLVSLLLLPWATFTIAAAPRAWASWLPAFLAFLLYGAGTLISGAPFLALVHDSAPYHARGKVMGIVQFMLVASFAFVPIAYARLLPSYEPHTFTRLIWVAVIGAGVLWFVAIWREERRGAQAPTPAQAAPPTLGTLRRQLARLWRDQTTRRYALFLGVSGFFAFMQDGVLEPFGGDVFGLSVGDTTRFNAYWGTGVLLAMMATLAATRRWLPHQHTRTTLWGLVGMAVMLVALAFVAYTRHAALIPVVLFIFGLAFGVFTVGGVALLMAMSRDEEAGTYLALWTVIQLLARGGGITAGGLLRDGAVALFEAFPAAYATVFACEALGIMLAAVLLLRVNVAAFVTPDTRVETGDLLEALADA
ncbi:MFS transporter, BCD family, chlorophyll transporter [Ardenticatena maritima]|uniref:MFS transporter, BCD family, chlorophyll transporter n=1 Tax=Ardenticatena maritima TaxID=872965 RepID=A0A0M8K5C1_9CHLR|nr:BCD family MFS transporter [Ardenticatena maritima]KPL89337.1 hypothetical protein SE16_02425 [Ardenticatena maritima]GAP61965.1 MFS transporter, BCD family, chlorophyll transporter [Ardenticatena maritima]